MQTYDAILVLGSQPDYRNWQFPSHTYLSLDRAQQLYQEGVAPCIALAGGYALKFDHVGITQPFKESDRLEEYLLSRGVPQEIILKEGESKDTIANLYYIKRRAFVPHNIRKILFITVDFRIARLRFLCDKVLGPDYQVDFETVAYEEDEVYKNEKHVLEVQSKFLADMKDGEDTWLDDKFYTGWLYEYWKDKAAAETDPTKKFYI